MGIALFVIALVSNIFIILIMRYGFTGNYEYKQGDASWCSYTTGEYW